jgi:glucose-6-phosphate 1-dehydrogenase
MTGDQTLFNRADMVEETWRVVGKVLDAWSTEKPQGFPNYTSGTDGPTEADALLKRSGRTWRSITDDGKSQ